VANASLVESPAPARRSDDKDWNEITTVTIVAHPDLTAEQQSSNRALKAVLTAG
jgi:hypothetical protein